MKDTIKLICNHQSLRHYTGEHLTAGQIKAIKDAVRQTSSTCFYQFISVLRVTDRELLRRIAELSGKQQHIAECAEFWVFLMDFSKIYHQQQMKHDIPFKLFQSAVTDATLYCENALIAAESMGLGGVIIGGFRNGIEEMSSLLKLPKYVAPSVCLCLGVPDERYREEQKPRFDDSWLFMENEYVDAFNEEDLKSYNDKYSEYNRSRKYNVSDLNWSETVAKRLPVRLDKSSLLAYYKKQGFDFN